MTRRPGARPDVATLVVRCRRHPQPDRAWNWLPDSWRRSANLRPAVLSVGHFATDDTEPAYLLRGVELVCALALISGTSPWNPWHRCVLEVAFIDGPGTDATCYAPDGSLVPHRGGDLDIHGDDDDGTGDPLNPRPMDGGTITFGAAPEHFRYQPVTGRPDPDPAPDPGQDTDQP